jgi:DNA polymerase III subunit epsilon
MSMNAPLRQIFLDTETTGLSASNDRVIEIGCVELVNRKRTGNNFQAYLNPEQPGSEEAFRIHGLSDAFLADKPKFAEVAEQLAEYLRGAEVLIHNASFDTGFVNAEFARVGGPRLQDLASGIVDTVALAKKQWPGKKASLDALCDKLGVSRANRSFHGALLDAQLLVDVYIAMSRGQDALAIDVEEAPTAATGVPIVSAHELELVVIAADEQELAGHEAVLLEIDKDSKGQTRWRPPPPKAPEKPAETVA